jgi:hypothetical protein
MTFLKMVTRGMLSSSRTAENVKLAAILVLISLLGSLLLAQHSLALGIEWVDPI